MQIALPQHKDDRASNEVSLVEAALFKICQASGRDTLLSSALQHHFLAGGSRTRAKLTYKVAQALSSPKEQSIKIACIPELLHNASLIHDDLQDQDSIRRGEVSVWKKFGSDTAICAGDYLISASYNCIADIETATKDLLIKTHQCVTNVIQGQVDDVTQDNMQSLDDIETYQKISAAKSGPLLSMCLSLPLIAAKRQEYVSIADKALEHFAVAYQIYDDINDIEQDQQKKGSASGVNIVSIMQKHQQHSPIMAAAELGLLHLKKAQKNAQDLPDELQVIINEEIDRMMQKIKLISQN